MPGNPVSKTGLIACPKNNINRRIKKSNDLFNLSKCATAKSITFSLRPFGGLYNPYAKGCSILCNHPGPNEVKTIVKQAKDAWLIEGKGHHYVRNDDHHDPLLSSTTTTTIKRLSNSGGGNIGDNHLEDIPEHIPEEFFRRYTGSDSRPLTPTPTVASGRTRTSTGSHIQNARRCFTPDPINNGAKERKQLILDLRRSHSQETLYWNASSELSPGLLDSQSKTTDPSGEKKNLRICEAEARKKSAERKTQQQESTTTNAGGGGGGGGDDDKPDQIVCINDQDEIEDEEDIPRRRGKRKKKPTGKMQPTTTTFQISQEPETQIATLGPDSPTNQSNRPSLVPNGRNLQTISQLNTNLTNTNESWGQSSFISEEALKYLRRGLTIDVVEATFQRGMNKALMEAYRTIPVDKINYESDALKKFKQTMNFINVDNEKWLGMPRKYTRNSARFSVPINTYDLASLTPFQYISKHVWVSNYRKQLYNYVFKQYLPVVLVPGVSGGEEGTTTMKSTSTALINGVGGGEQDDIGAGAGGDGGDGCNDQNDEILFENLASTKDQEKNTIAKIPDHEKERSIKFSDLHNALKDVLGFHGTDEKIDKVKELLQLTQTEYKEINFRSWCGIVAFSERYLNQLNHKEDPCDEIEIADFESLERKFSYVNVQEPLKVILNLIKNE